ncbi:BlaI/MecI/CopY family transcriptional regulator [Bowmanella sp. JS7-9]|uniref:BlaI/MecI/CopY family transcriptional regulator n=1 Tax=Pseudobowmanella zhangzhouensis TaxID=1537679 RepID=A0ABW1XF84_9ALTE|nr:BlaI/MecI/CopY family transcriptional regulator [Bowmanella sp. JS7-9]TBX20818.1 CopY family transcriptional repressor [Bowmanella sp. JS7-9]
MEISKAEFEVMNAVWQGAPCTAADVVARLDNQTDWHEKTVKTLLNRLVKKGALGFDKDGRRYLYKPLFGRDEYRIKESTSLLNRLFDGRVSPLVSAFASRKQLSQQDIEELKDLIKQWEQTND